MSENTPCIKGKVHGLTSNLLKENTDVDDDMMLKLSLSTIVDLIQQDSYNILKKLFTRKEMKAIEIVTLDLYVGLSEENQKLLKKVVRRIENIENYSEADSEMTFYRNCAKIIDYLFSGTGLKLS
ncbi:hypothetical protein DFQ28_009000, partial [Apophysomyces sp. BC1034]